ncbi:hypothetical protein OY671_008606, partial [Metschnikowia pulcherrima]
CGGEASDVSRVGAPPSARKTVAYDPASAGRSGGVAVAEDEQRRILAVSGFEAAAGEGSGWTVTVPTWRPDVDGAADIVEEVIRVHGSDAVPSTPSPRADGVAKPTATPAQIVERRVRRAAAARGSHEAVTWSFSPEGEAEHFTEGDGGSWVSANPISEDLKAMRPSSSPGSLSATRRNLDRGAASVRSFEIGRRYSRGEAGASDEKLSLVVVSAGEKTPRGWKTGKAQAFDAFDAKAEASASSAEAGAPVDNSQVMGEAGPQ